MSTKDEAFRQGAASDQNEIINSTGTAAHEDNRGFVERVKDSFSSATDQAQKSLGGGASGEPIDAGMPSQPGGFADKIQAAVGDKDIGGNQLFGKTSAAHPEDKAAGDFLHKYTNESAPGENTA